jgi:hypothetical protein
VASSAWRPEHSTLTTLWRAPTQNMTARTRVVKEPEHHARPAGGAREPAATRREQLTARLNQRLGADAQPPATLVPASGRRGPRQAPRRGAF